jgi:RimJ/RimL family protein N-acetyltransferase
MSVALTRAEYDRDWADLFAWRNDERTRLMSLSTERVGLEDHLKWLKATLEKPTVRLFVARDPMTAMKVGTARIDQLSATTVELSITVAPRARGLGYAAQVLYHLVRQVPAEFPKTKIIKAQIKEENDASLCAFAACNFAIGKVKNGVAELTYRGPA